MKNAPYNPRSISDAAKKKLRQGIERFGVVDYPVWNVRTGNIVGGHRRTEALDALAGSEDYTLWAQQIDVDDKTEKELNIFLNNADAQGDFDMDKLGAMFKDGELTVENTGFDLGLVYEMFGDQLVEKEADALLKKAEEYKKIKENFKKKKAETNNETDDPSFFLVAVFGSYEQRKAFTDRYDLDDLQFVDGRVLEEALRA